MGADFLCTCSSLDCSWSLGFSFSWALFLAAAINVCGPVIVVHDLGLLGGLGVVVIIFIWFIDWDVFYFPSFQKLIRCKGIIIRKDYWLWNKISSAIMSSFGLRHFGWILFIIYKQGMSNKKQNWIKWSNVLSGRLKEILFLPQSKVILYFIHLWGGQGSHKIYLKHAN